MTTKELAQMCREYCHQSFMGEVSNDDAWVEWYLKQLKTKKKVRHD